MDGKRNLEGILSLLRKGIRDTILIFAVKVLSDFIKKQENKKRPNYFPVLTEVDGKIVHAMVSFDSINNWLIMKLRVVEGTVNGNDKPVEIPRCLTIEFLAKKSLDSEFDHEI